MNMSALLAIVEELTLPSSPTDWVGGSTSRLDLLPGPLRLEVIKQCNALCDLHRGGDPDWLCVERNHACFECQHRAAQAIEAQRAATGNTDAVEDESAVAESDAPINKPVDPYALGGGK